MKASEYEKMYRAETRFWWFVGKGRLVEMLSERWLSGTGLGLDLGCGSGANLDRAARRGQWIGIDLSPEALRFCAERGHRRLVVADAGRLPLADDTVDAATALDVLEHLPDDGAALAELFRVLRPGGRLLMTVPAHRFLWSAHDLALGHHRRYDRKGLAGLMASAGFRPIWSSHFMALLFPLMAVGKMWQRYFGDREETIGYDWPGWINRLFLAIVETEIVLLKSFIMPFGATLVVVCEKPISSLDARSRR